MATKHLFFSLNFPLVIGICLLLPCLLPAQQTTTSSAYDDFYAKLAEAKKQDKPIVLYLVNESSKASKKFDSEIMTQENVARIFQPYILTRVNTDSDYGKNIHKAYGWQRAPFLAVLNRDGETFKTLDLSMLTDDLINANLSKQIENWLTNNAKRFETYKGLGYKQQNIPNDDPIREVIKKWQTQKAGYPSDTGVYLLNHASVQVSDDYRSTIKSHIILYLGKYSQIPTFDWKNLFRGTVSFKLIRARTITPDLKEKLVDPADVEETPVYRNYPEWNKFHETKFVFPGTKEGCYLEYEIEISDSPQMPGHFSCSWNIENSNIPFLDSHFDIIAPSSANLKHRIYNHTTPAKVETISDKTRITWDGSSQNYRKIDKDDVKNPVRSYLIASTALDWENIGKWFLSQVNPARKHSKEMDDWIDRITKTISKDDKYEKRVTNALVNAMHKEFRYLSIEISTTGYQPHPLDEIFKNKYGDCKDLSLFLQEALKRVGVTSDLVLLSPNSSDIIGDELPRVPYFTHCILRVKTGNQYFFVDPVVKDFSAGTLPYSEVATPALICSDEKVFMDHTPSVADSSGVQFDIRLDNIEKDNVKTNLTIRSVGTAMEIIRDEFNSFSEEKQKLSAKEYLHNFFNEFSSTKMDVTGEQKNAEYHEIRYEGTLPKPFITNDSMVIIPSFIFYSNFYRGFPDYRSNRHEEKNLGFFTGIKTAPVTEKIIYTIPKGLQPKDMPETINVDNDYFKINRTTEFKNDKLTITTSLEVKYVPGQSRFVKESDLPADSKNIVDRLSKPIFLQRQSDSFLRSACEKGDLPSVQKLVESGVDIESPDNRGRTPLMIAAATGKADIARYLIEKHANVNAVNGDNEAALFLALNAGKGEVANILLDNGADPNIPTKKGFTPLMAAACFKNECDVLKRLIDLKVNLNANSIEGPAISKAAQCGNAEAISLLAKAGADLYIAIPESGVGEMMQYNLLGHTAKIGNVEATKALIDSKFEVDRRMRDDSTPLMIAAWNKRKEIIDILLQAGAKIDLQRDDGSTALMDIAGDDEPEMMKFLLERKANPNIQDFYGYTALMYACRNGNLQCARTLIEAGADINISNSNGENAIIEAAGRGHIEIIQYLQEHGAKETEFHVPKKEQRKDPYPSAKRWALAIPAVNFQTLGRQVQYLGGYEKPVVRYPKKRLQDDWDIKNKTDLINTLHDLKDGGQHATYQLQGKKLAALSDEQFELFVNGPTTNSEIANKLKIVRKHYMKWGDRIALAWDWCRYAALVHEGYGAGYLTEKEAFDYLMPLARLIQKNFTSWEEMGANYLDGREIWKKKRDENLDFCFKLLVNKNDPNSPWNQIPWDTDLSDTAVPVQ